MKVQNVVRSRADVQGHHAPGQRQRSRGAVACHQRPDRHGVAMRRQPHRHVHARQQPVGPRLLLGAAARLREQRRVGRGNRHVVSRITASGGRQPRLRVDHPLAHRGGRRPGQEDGRGPGPGGRDAARQQRRDVRQRHAPRRPRGLRSSAGCCSAAAAARSVRTRSSPCRRPSRTFARCGICTSPILNDYFKLGVKSFGTDLRGVPNKSISEILVG